MPTTIESTDILGSGATAAVLAMGATARGTIGVNGDHDWYKVDLVAGQTYTFALVGTGANNLTDPYLSLYATNATTQLAFNDDGLVNGNSTITYTPTVSGTYFLDASAFSSGTGQYGISATLGTKASFDAEMIAGVLDTHTTWSLARGTGATVTYGFRDTYTGTVTNVTHVGAAQQAAVALALQFYSEITGLTFQRVNPTGYTDSATMLFSDYAANDGAGAYAYYPGSTASTSVAGDVWMNTSVSATSLPYGSYSLFAIMHELGHALGLSHPGTYNAGVGVSITYANNAQFVQDSNQYSIMSYFGASATGGSQGGYADTPMLYDIAALQQIYGANMATRSGDTVYGYGSTAGALYDFAINTTPALCIWDGGGNDTLNSSGYSGAQTLSLVSGELSSLNGLVGNVSIAYGATVENAVGGTGSDTITGNAVANRLTGGGGDDILRGDAGGDTLEGGTGNDTLDGGADSDTARFSGTFASYVFVGAGSDVSVTDRVSGRDGTDHLLNIEFMQFSDGTFSTGALSRTIESVASTSLVQQGGNYYLYAAGASTGPELFRNGTPVTVGQFGTWEPIGAEKTATGYVVAWKDTPSGQFTIWTTDNNGNFISHIGAVSGTNTLLTSAEPACHQDLNGDGVITIESVASTALVQQGSNYYLFAAGASSGPELFRNGAPVTVGQFGTWEPIGAEKTATGYLVAWKDTPSGQFTVWTTDVNGAFISHIGAVMGTNTLLEGAEAQLKQDLNGDGLIGIPVESVGSTCLVLQGSNYYLVPPGASSGPELFRNGAPVTVGQFGTWEAIGAEKTAAGYLVAWRDKPSGQFTIWTTDVNGAFISHIGAVSGTNTLLTSAEPAFHQDLNGDGVIGIPVPALQASKLANFVSTAIQGNTTKLSTVDVVNHIDLIAVEPAYDLGSHYGIDSLYDGSVGYASVIHQYGLGSDVGHTLDTTIDLRAIMRSAPSLSLQTQGADALIHMSVPTGTADDVTTFDGRVGPLTIGDSIHI